METSENTILNATQIEHKIRRIAYQVYESNINEQDVVIAGIKENGFILAKKIKKVLEEVTPLKGILCEVVIHKKEPTRPVTTSLNETDYTNKSVLLVDDVLHTGTTLIYGVKHFLNVPLKQLKTIVLVDRNHKRFPVKADFKGISLSTSINENVSVIFEKNKDRAVLD